MPREYVFHPKYSPLFQTNRRGGPRYTLITGGRGSGKSTAASAANVCDSYADNYTQLYSRYTLVSAEVSVIPEYIDKIRLLGKTRHFRETKEDVINLKSGGHIFFRGIKGSSGNQIARLKSIHKLRKFFLDEAQELTSETDFDTIDLSIRELEAANEVWMSLNPTDIHHWIFRRFFREPGVPFDFNGVVDNVRYIHTDWRDNRSNLAQSFIEMALKCQRDNPERYDNIYLGNWAVKRNGLIYPRWQEVTRAEIPLGLEWWYCNDWGYSGDPDALCKMAFDPLTRTLYVVEVMYEKGKLPKHVAAAIRQDCEASGLNADAMVVYCDPARPDSIRELREQYGINALPGINRDKPGRIGYLQGFRVRFVGPNIAEEAATYSWLPSPTDENVFTDVPQDGGDHAMDAISYGSTHLRRLRIPNDDGDLPK